MHSSKCPSHHQGKETCDPLQRGVFRPLTAPENEGHLPCGGSRDKRAGDTEGSGVLQVSPTVKQNRLPAILDVLLKFFFTLSLREFNFELQEKQQENFFPLSSVTEMSLNSLSTDLVQIGKEISFLAHKLNLFACKNSFCVGFKFSRFQCSAFYYQE